MIKAKHNLTDDGVSALFARNYSKSVKSDAYEKSAARRPIIRMNKLVYLNDVA